MLKAESTSLNTERVRPFLIPGVIVFFVFISGLFLVRPRISEIFKIQRNLRREEKRLAQLTAKTAALEGLDQVELSEKAEIAAKALPTEKNVPLLLSILKTIAAKNNVELHSLQVDPGELATTSAKGKKGELPVLSFKVSVSGQISDFEEFLAQIATIAPLIRVQSVVIDSKGAKGSSQANILLDSPFLPPPASLGSIEKPLPQITRKEEEAYQKLAQLEFSLAKERLPSVPSGKENPFVF